MRWILGVSILAILLSLAGCIYLDAKSYPMGIDRHPPKSADYEVLNYASLLLVERPYDKVARIYIVGIRPTFAEVEELAHHEARLYGADAVVYTQGQTGYITAIRYRDQ
ncbi:MAG: hypothetical protein ACYTG7_16630 [Planctomycetota bacterium]|jgi:hypothetical protein